MGASRSNVRRKTASTEPLDDILQTLRNYLDNVGESVDAVILGELSAKKTLI